VESRRELKVIHTYVALCDNASQGIAPVPAKIGDCNDPANNLYWGCSDGARSYLSKSKLSKDGSNKKPPKIYVSERPKPMLKTKKSAPKVL